MNNIAFPRIGITMNINPVAFCIGAKSIYWYALIILSGFLFGTLFVCCACEKRGIKKDSVWDIALYGLIFGILGARAYYVIFSLDEFIGDIAGIFRIWNGGLAIYGGIIGAVISTYIYCRIKKISPAKAFDVCCPGLLIGQAIGRFGNFTNAEVYGKVTGSFLGMSINGADPVHPLFLYESAWNLLGLIIIILFRDKKRADGQVFCFYVFWYSIGRLFLEGMRDSAYILYVIPGVLAASQAVAALAAAASVIAFLILLRASALRKR